MITAKGVCRYFTNAEGGTHKALENINLQVPDGQCVLLAGENGSGKSLLMKLIAKLDSPTKGTVESSEPVGLVFQDADAQILADTVVEDVLFGLRMKKGLSKADAKKLAVEALAKVGLESKAENPSHFLSGGEKRRLAIASILALGRRTVILDEPYSNLDYPGVKSVNAIVEKLKQSAMTVIILTHELEKCLGLADRVLVLHQGQMVFDGSPSEALSQDLEAWGVRNPSKNGDPKLLVWR